MTSKRDHQLLWLFAIVCTKLHMKQSWDSAREVQGMLRVDKAWGQYEST